MRQLKTLASALAIVMVIVMATDYIALAATGRTLILGKVNKAKKTTTIKSAKGPALKLTTKPGQPPLAVNSKTVVKNLNADLLDGKSASDLRPATLLFSRTETDVSTASNYFVAVPGVAPGSYFASYSIYMVGATGSPAAPVAGQCYWLTLSAGGSATSFSGESRATSIGTSLGFNANSLVTLAAGESLSLKCTVSVGSLTWSTDSREPVQITLTKAEVAAPKVLARATSRRGTNR